MAELLGVHKNTYARWERGEREPSSSDLERLALNGWSIDWLLTGRGPERVDAINSAGVAETRANYDTAPAMWAERLGLALELADEAVSGLWLPRSAYAALVARIYEDLERGQPLANVLEDAKKAATSSAGLAGSSRSPPA